MYNEVVACSLLLCVPHKRSSREKEKKSESDKVIIVAHLSIKNVFFFCVASKPRFLFFAAASNGGQVLTTPLTPHASSETHCYFRRVSEAPSPWSFVRLSHLLREAAAWLFQI